MGYQVCVWSRVPQCPQMPPPHYPQVQVRRRGNAHRGVKEGESVIAKRERRSHKDEASVSFFFLLLGSYSIDCFCKVQRMSLTGACLLRNATIIFFHIRRGFSSSGARRLEIFFPGH